MSCGGLNDELEQVGAKGRESLVVRIAVRASALGFPKIPVGMHLRPLRPKQGEWSLLVSTFPGKVREAVSWFQKWGPTVCEPEPGLSPSRVHMEFPQIPEDWGRLFTTVEVDHLCLTRVDIISLLAKGTPEEISGYLESLQKEVGGTEKLRVRGAGLAPYPLERLLTPRQLETVFLAETLGYYDRDRRLSLRELAKKTDRSLASVSQIMRRAEARIMQASIDMMATGMGREEGPAGSIPESGDEDDQ
jgi:hypothetical protein